MKKTLFLITLFTLFQSCTMLNVMDDIGRGTEAMKYKALGYEEVENIVERFRDTPYTGTMDCIWGRSGQRWCKVTSVRKK